MSDEKKERGPQVPTVGDLDQWHAEGGCYTACEHEEWVEPDGYCSECGAGSWLLKLEWI